MEAVFSKRDGEKRTKETKSLSINIFWFSQSNMCMYLHTLSTPYCIYPFKYFPLFLPVPLFRYTLKFFFYRKLLRYWLFKVIFALQFTLNWIKTLAFKETRICSFSYLVQTSWAFMLAKEAGCLRKRVLLWIKSASVNVPLI